MSQYEETQDEIAKLYKQLENKNNEIAKLKSSLDSAKAKCKELSSDKVDNSDILESLYNEVRTLRNDNLYLTAKIKETKRKLM